MAIHGFDIAVGMSPEGCSKHVNIIQCDKVEEAGKGATPAVLKAILAAFKNEMLKEQL